jgi:hypothetical protein
MQEIEYAGEVERSPEIDRSLNLRAREVARTIWKRGTGFVRANRQAWDNELLVDGVPVNWTPLDRARFDRHGLGVEAANTAFDRAITAQETPYSLASEIAFLVGNKIKRGAALLGACGLAVAGAALGIFAALEANTPDSVLVQRAIDGFKEARAPDPPSAADVREMYLWMMAVALFAVIAGLHYAREWFRPKAR